MEASHSWIRKVLFVNSKKLIKPCGKNGVLLKWYNTCEGIGLVYHNIDPYARKDKSQTAPKEVVNALITIAL